jgi:hypothetical protein
MENITSYVLIGALVAALVQFLKIKFGTTSTITLVIVSVISILAGTIYFFLRETQLLASIISILGFAGAVYTYIFKRFED